MLFPRPDRFSNHLPLQPPPLRPTWRSLSSSCQRYPALMRAHSVRLPSPLPPFRLLTSPRIGRHDLLELPDGHICRPGSHTASAPCMVVHRRLLTMGRTTPLHTGPVHTSRGPRPMPPAISACAACGPGVGVRAFSQSNRFGCVVATLSFSDADLIFSRFLTDLVFQQ